MPEQTSPSSAGNWRSIHVSAQDGLKLHARDHGPLLGGRTPLVCLAGLTRNAADFEEIAAALSNGPHARRVVSIDYRGRGLSDWDPNPTNYDIRVESADIQAILTALDIGHAIFLGTSRGGLHIMALAAFRPGLLAGAILNDIGPELSLPGLMRIKGYVGKMPAPATMADAADILKTISAGGFPGFTSADWMRLARKTFAERDGRIHALYDPSLMATLDAYSAESPPPALWNLFDGLAKVPLMTIRGENSDLFLPQTLEAMKAKRPDMEVLTIPGQAHAPPLWEEDVVAKISAFALTCDHR